MNLYKRCCCSCPTSSFFFCIIVRLINTLLHTPTESLKSHNPSSLLSIKPSFSPLHFCTSIYKSHIKRILPHTNNKTQTQRSTCLLSLLVLPSARVPPLPVAASSPSSARSGALPGHSSPIRLSVFPSPPAQLPPTGVDRLRELPGRVSCMQHQLLFSVKVFG